MILIRKMEEIGNGRRKRLIAGTMERSGRTQGKNGCKRVQDVSFGIGFL